MSDASFSRKTPPTSVPPKQIYEERPKEASFAFHSASFVELGIGAPTPVPHPPAHLQIQRLFIIANFPKLLDARTLISN